jgi:hypothetical protein
MRPSRPALPSLQRSLESSDIGRALISAFILVTLAGVLITNLSDSKLKRDLDRRSGSYLASVGLDQGWGMFAPDTRPYAVHMYARVRFDDGQTRNWDPPRNGDLVGAYRDYHWQKWMEIVVHSSRLWRQAALYAAKHTDGEGAQPVDVTLVHRVRANFPPGSERSTGVWRAKPFYKLRLTPAVLREERI